MSDFRPAPMRGILNGPVDGAAKMRATYPEVEAAIGLAAAHRASGFRGKVARHERDGVVLRATVGGDRLFRLVPGAFEVDGRAVTLTVPRPRRDSTQAPNRTASGSVAVKHDARVAQAGRIWVEGVHDAALVEKVWGDDLRLVGVVVERLDGIDELAGEVRAFRPTAQRRLGILVDHLVVGSKEAKLAAAVQGPHVLVTGTPFVDVWQAVRPHVLGIPGWPTIPMGTPWKEGVCARLGLGEPRDAWRRILSSVRSYADLEPSLVGAVEELIDFVTDVGSP
ncbi:MAG: FIG01125565: hypothetical protein [uncultured Acidimicrobiales bacterium]|uniref:DUF3097 domain-containing protein n=1 Tax=uncultured Acidimicrobiales bacterium TaxID=310071 RepID=A0A6J4IQJ6_9ACTN|nr:MAG: FIG01125565: hypothetical protein [uncultured Acidimicrobiales bacterium]